MKFGDKGYDYCNNVDGSYMVVGLLKSVMNYVFFEGIEKKNDKKVIYLIIYLIYIYILCMIIFFLLYILLLIYWFVRNWFCL